MPWYSSEFIPVGNMPQQVAKPASLGFVELDAYALSVVRPVAAARASYGDGSTIIPLFSNYGFLPFLRNLLCSFHRLRVQNFIVIAMDNETCPALQKEGAGDAWSVAACVYPYLRSSTAVTSDTRVATYRSVNFNRMVMQRPLWVRWLLEQGYSVIQCDLDIVWLHDPQPLLRSWRVAKTGRIPDMVFQSEQAYGLNGGFYFARPTNATLTFFAAWVERLTAMIHLASFEEQHALNSALMRSKRGLLPGGVVLLYDQLHEQHFPNGKMWWSYPWAVDKRVAYIVHANWVKQQKKSRLLRDNLWFLEPSDTKCQAGFDPFVDNCSKLCAPISFVAPGNRPHAHKRCWDLNKEDDYQTRKARQRYDKNNSWPQLRGMFWHPRAYAAIPGCVRNLTRQEHAASVYERLVATVWSHDAVLPVMRSAKHTAVATVMSL